LSSSPAPVIAVIGGTGKLGAALARRWAKAGLTVSIGSRDAAKAAKAAAELSAEIGRTVTGGSNADVAKSADTLVVTVPFAAQADTLADIRAEAEGKLVIDTTVPLVPPKVMRVQLPPEGSAAVRAQQLLGENVTVVSAFHSVAAHKLATDEEVACDVLVFGDDKAARDRAVALAKAAGLRGLHAGALVNSAAAEALTSVLIFLNKTYSVDGAGVQITGKLIEPA
jgi:8-hydroxy-5-deazaflavin:NADPH oxidoreductase